jgi:integrase/recombinase XerD
LEEGHPNIWPLSQADDDQQFLALWVGRHSSQHTRSAYARRARDFLAFVNCPLGRVRVADVQAYLATLADLAPATRANAAATLKSMFSFAQEIGFIRFNVGKAVRLPPVKNKLAERILGEADVLRMIVLEPDLRNRVIFTVLYAGGLRVSELCALTWRDLTARDDAGQATIFGKGGKTRAILFSAATWKGLEAITGATILEGPVFRSRKGGALDRAQVHRIVKAAAMRAGLSADVSAHWLRHAHASHSLERGAPIHLVQATLGHASVATTGRYLHARPTDSSARYLGV